MEQRKTSKVLGFRENRTFNKITDAKRRWTDHTTPPLFHIRFMSLVDANPLLSNFREPP